MYKYRCEKCNSDSFVNVKISDLVGSKGIIKDLAEYQRRIDEKRFCDCGGELKHVSSSMTQCEPMFFNPLNLKGKISRRFS